MSRARAREIARSFLEKGDPKGWFEALYREAAAEPSLIPWADMVANPHLLSWLDKRGIRGEGKRAMVVGSGLGDDAELLSSRGFEVTAFDISPEAIRQCRQRFPDSSVNYLVADLFNPPVSWQGSFHLVLEAYTLQVLPPELRRPAIKAISPWVREGGILLAIARAREPQEDPGRMPWPLTRQEFTAFYEAGLECVSWEDYFDQEDPPVRRFRVEYRKRTGTL